MSIDVTRLKYFVAVAEDLHFKRAADRLMITPPPLSKQIRQLEHELGGDLFERGYHTVRLTSLGEALLGPAREILDRMEDLKGRAADHLGGASAVVRIGATAYAAPSLLDRIEHALPEMAHPSSFQIDATAIEVASRLISGQLDLGIVHLPVSDQRIRYRVIAETGSAIAVRSDDPVAARDSITVGELRDRQLVVDFARANPTVFANTIRQLRERGVNEIVHVDGGGSEIAAAAQVHSRRLVALISSHPDSPLRGIFAPPRFAVIPLDREDWPPTQLAVGWSPAMVQRKPYLREFMAEFCERIGSESLVGAQ